MPDDNADFEIDASKLMPMTARLAERKYGVERVRELPDIEQSYEPEPASRLRYWCGVALFVIVATGLALLFGWMSGGGWRG